MLKLLVLIMLVIAKPVSAMAPKINWDKAIDRAIARYGLKTEPELKQYFAKAHVEYPPNEVALLTFKKELKIEMWAQDSDSGWRYIHSYPLTASSGRLGPKLKEHDLQIPEGIYRLVSFNPFSSMHLSIMIDYPNYFDKLQAIKDGRKKLGNNIFLHGKSYSVGCLSVGNHAIDQLFLLARRVGLSNIKLIIAPNDLRNSKPATAEFAQPRWLPELYRQIRHELRPFYKSKSV